ncbi:MAG: DNA/RNA endonuclease G [Erythrobacter sp.]|nr:DNA/RNA endonuclease G [Erythrobacter sp.]MBA4080860.1 DNA/RNA endonuclease G [Erythrobacter sp.]
MNDPFLMQRELRYGYPVCDQLLTGRNLTVGYSWYFRQAKWTLEIVRRDWELINDTVPEFERLDNFRADTRIPQRFRAGLKAYKGSGYDRRHLVASANADQLLIQNSETFLLSNMSPQHPDLNRKRWRELEEAIRELDAREDVLETYVLTCPVFYFGEPIERIGKNLPDFGISVPVPHAFIKSVLIEDLDGRHRLWTFKMENPPLVADPAAPDPLANRDLASYLMKTYDAEQLVGGKFWDGISGGDLHAPKGGGKKIEAMWPKDPKAKFQGLKHEPPAL